MFQLLPGHLPLSDQEVIETQILKFIKTRVRHIATKVDFFVGRVRTREIIPRSSEMIPVMKRSSHNEGTRRSESLVRSTTLSKHSKMGGVEECLAVRLDK